VSRLSDLIANAEAKDPQLGTDLECEFRALSSRLSLGFNFDRQTREDWSSSDKTSSKGEARRVSVGSANQFNKFQEGCVEENTNTAAIVLR
jgi:hypothetical protein